MRSLRTLDQTVWEIWACYDGLAEHEAHPFAPSPQGLRDLTAQVEAATLRLHSLAPWSRRRSAETVHQAHLQDVLEVLLTRLADDPAWPHRYLHRLAARVYSLLDPDPRPACQRAQLLAGVLSGAPPVLEAARDLALLAPAQRRGAFCLTATRLATQLGTLPGRLEAALGGVGDAALVDLAAAAQAAAQLAHEARAAVQAAPEPELARQQPRITYGETLRRLYGIELDDLLCRYRDEVARCQAALSAVARKIDPSRDPLTILAQDSPPYDCPEAMYLALGECMALTRRWAWDQISLPQGEICAVRPMPEYLQDHNPWSDYHAGGAAGGGVWGCVFLNRANYRRMGRAWVQATAAHQCYPGHHALQVQTMMGDMPPTFKLHSLINRSAPLAEGVAVRSEILLQETFNEPIYRLVVAYRRLLDAVRVWADLELWHLGGGMPAAVELFRRYLGLDDHIAAGQASAQYLKPGYYTVHHYGLRELSRMQSRAGWDDHRFTQLILSCGRLSLPVLQRLLRLEEHERTGLVALYSQTDS